MSDDNPWEVESIQDFLFLKCPECIFDTKEENIFQGHALEKHPLSFVFFGKTCKEEDNYDSNYKQEDSNPDVFEDYDEDIPSIPPEIKIKEEEDELETEQNHEVHEEGNNLNDENGKRYQCPLCDKSYPYNQSLKQHIESVHEGKKPFQCTQCDARFTQKHGLNGHIAAIHEKKIR